MRSKPESARELAPLRRDRLLEELRRSRAAGVAELRRALGVSPATLRRDLEALAAQGRVRRVHGGALSVESRLEEPLFEDKTALAARQKQRIARAALALVKPGEAVYLDGGSTVLELARLLRDRTDLTVVTNSLRAMLELSGSGPRVISVGGDLRRLSQTLVGPLTDPVLGELRLDKAFMGAIGFSLDGELTTTDPAEAHTKRLVMERSREVILLADSGKAGKVSFARAGRLADVHVLVTDKGLDRRFAKELARLGVRLILA